MTLIPMASDDDRTGSSSDDSSSSEDSDGESKAKNSWHLKDAHKHKKRVLIKEAT